MNFKTDKGLITTTLDSEDETMMLEMCNILFPGEWVYFKTNNNLSYFRYRENPSDIVFKNFNWLELCLNYLFPYLYERIKWDTNKKDFVFSQEIEEEFDFFDYNTIDKESFVECFIFSNPVEYLHERFKSIQDTL
jgi:hypothetical protein